MNGLSKLIALGVLTIVACGGCGGPVTAPPVSAAGCAGAAVNAIRQHVAIPRLPAACDRLSAAGLDQAIRITVIQFSDRAAKARRRHLEGIVRAHLGTLIAAAQRADAAQRRVAVRRAAVRARRRAAQPPGGLPVAGARGTGIPARSAALAAWLLTAGSGGVLLVRSMSRRRPAPGQAGPATLAGRPPGIILSHAGLAACGLAVWSAYLLSGSTLMAWAALAILLPVIGLGMAALMHVIDGPAVTRMPALLIAAHGALATATMLLALLGAVAALAGH